MRGVKGAIGEGSGGGQNIGFFNLVGSTRLHEGTRIETVGSIRSMTVHPMDLSQISSASCRRGPESRGPVILVENWLSDVKSITAVLDRGEFLVAVIRNIIGD